MKKGELISILMGIYNIPTKKDLSDAILSILNQTYKNFEFIIIDDGSTNDTYKWAKELTKGDKRVRLYQNEKNLGLVKTLNKCLDLAKGDIIARMDGDDYAALDRLEKQYEFLKNNKEYGLVGTNAYYFDEVGIFKTSKFKEKITKKDFLFNSPVIHPTVMTYKNLVIENGSYKDVWYTDRCEDYNLFMEMFANGVKMYTLQEPLYYYRTARSEFNKRKYKYRINESVVRAKGFKKLHLYPKGIIYVFKPLIVGLIPLKLLNKIKNKRK